MKSSSPTRTTQMGRYERADPSARFEASSISSEPPILSSSSTVHAFMPQLDLPLDNGGRNRDRTYDLCDVNAALVPTELCAPGSHLASVSAADDTSAFPPLPDRGESRPRRPAV